MGDMHPILVPDELREAFAAEAASEGLSVEAMVARAMQLHLEAIKTRKFFEERARKADPEWLMQFLSRDGGEPPQPGDELPDGYVRTT